MAIKMKNHLKNETSPYLLQHVENPVDWYPWCEEAFEKAKREDKPIFLSIGYSTCHWCHVMAHESFENKKVAKILNKDFVSIKVDREERPDIDSVYMSVCQACTGNGGWPMSIFMTWDKKPFFAGTYFPLQPCYGMPGFASLLEAIANQWGGRRDELLSSANQIIQYLKSSGSGHKAGGNENMLEKAVQKFFDSFDSKYGGFGDAPKFPTPHNLLFLALYAVQNEREDSQKGQRDPKQKIFTNAQTYEPVEEGRMRKDNRRLLEMVEKTLTQMRKGGIFDQIGYGFSRYSTDKYFLAPHFEKMLYDNALLIIAYASVYAITKKRLYLDTAEKTAEYIFCEMTFGAPSEKKTKAVPKMPARKTFKALSKESTEETFRVYQGRGFYSAQDADSEGIEGRYYTFTQDEIFALLGEERGKAFADTFDISANGNFEGVNIPNLLKSNNLNSDFDKELQILYDYRKKRTKLHLDDKIITSQNAMMIIALSVLYRVARDEKYLQAAVSGQTFIETNLTGGAEGLSLHTSWCKGKCSGKGFLDDYAFYVTALMELYHSTLKKDYLEKAELFCNEAVNRFFDNENGGFYLSDGNGTELFMNPKETYDGAIPSGNSVMTYNLVRLYQLTEKEEYGEFARKQIHYMSGRAQDYLTGHSMFLIAKLLYDDPPEHITIVLKDDSDLEKIKRQLPLLANVVVAAQSREFPLMNERTTFYICKGHACFAPTNTL